jgi:hypothetical protein
LAGGRNLLLLASSRSQVLRFIKGECKMNCSAWGAALRLFIVIAITSLVATSASLLADEENDYVPGEVVVKLVQAADLASIAAAFQLDPTPLDQFGARPIYRLRILDGVDPQVKAGALASDPRDSPAGGAYNHARRRRHCRCARYGY